MKLDHLCDVSIERSAGGFGTLHSLTPDDGMRTGPISLHNAIGSAHLQQESSAATVEFETLLHLLVDIQDHYLPEIRSNQRVGEYRDYRGSAAIGGTYFFGRTEYMLSAIRKWRRH